MLLHVLAGHPRLVAAFGIAAVVVLLSSPLGPGAHLGTDRYAARLEREVAARAGVSDAAYAQAQGTADRLIAAHDPTIARRIATALARCGTNCSDLALQTVMEDRALEREVLVMYALDQLATRPPVRSAAANSETR